MRVKQSVAIRVVVIDRIRQVPSIGTGERNGPLNPSAQHLAAPLHVVEEEGLGSGASLELYGAADVETPKVKAQLLHVQRARTEPTACIQGIVAPEPPRRAMKLVGAALDGGADRGTRNQPELGGVVRGLHTEFRQR